MPSSVTCPGCGSAVPSGDRFCGACGNPITGSALLSGDGARFDPWMELLQKLRNATIGEYEIRGELGRGGMAAVFLAHDMQLNRRVAIKVMLPGLTYGERMWDRFLAEARTAAKLDHPHIVYIHSVKEKDRFLYFVMKHIDGCSVDDLVPQHKPFPIPVAMTILSDVARALDYAHREGVIHRDVKPANIMVDLKGSAIVMDFGIARAVDTQHFTQTGATIGTPAYMSPEQCHGSEATVASDQYALGILAYELLTGAPPFSGTPIELQVAHMQDAPVPIRDRRPELSLELSGAVMRMLSKDPAARWPSLRELVPIFSRGLDELGDAPREQLVEMVRLAAPRRRSFPSTPISPPPAGSAWARAPYAPHTPLDGTPASAGGGGAEPWRTGGSEQEAPTQISGTSVAVSPAPSEEIWQVAAAHEGDSMLGERMWPRLSGTTVTGLSIGAVLVVAAALAFRGVPKPATPASPSAAELAAAAAAVTPTVTVPQPPQSRLADSVAIGPVPASGSAASGKTPREVTIDDVAYLELSFPRARASVGDTVRARLQAQDDAGFAVTTSDLVWTTSNPEVVRLAGPARLIAVKEGKSKITVSAGSVTAARELTVVTKKR